jgi:hypothetical protein
MIGRQSKKQNAVTDKFSIQNNCVKPRIARRHNCTEATSANEEMSSTEPGLI